MATQNDADGHDTAVMPSPLEVTFAGFDHAEPSHVDARPLLTPAMQNDEEAHATAANWSAATRLATDHDDPLDVKAYPPLFTAAQKLVLGHDTDTRLPTPPRATGADQDVPL